MLSECPHQTVHVKMVSMITTNLSVDHVETNVKLVITVKDVSPVNQVESTHQSVSALMVNMMMDIPVYLVPTNV